MKEFFAASLVALVSLAASTAHADPWTISFGFADARSGPCVQVLPDGRVLVIGGDDGAGHPAEHTTIYQPTTGAVTETGGGRISQGCVQKLDGDVMIGGGFAGLSNASTAKVFTKTATDWTSLANMLGKGAGFALVQLDTDKMMMLGGYDTSGQDTEIYSFASNTWVAGPLLTVDRSNGRALRLADGTILAIGGTGGTAAERYRPATGKWTATAGAMKAAHSGASTLTLLASGKVLVVGETAVAELFDPATDRFTTTGSMATLRSNHVAVRLKDGRVLVAGGTGGNSSEIYDPATGLFTGAGNTVLARSFAGGGLMNDGRVVVAGGKVKGFLDSTAETWGLLDGAACTADNDCVSGNCTDGVCCNVSKCATGMSCGIPPALGRCTKTAGTACTTDTECATGHCADGVCCQTTCTGLCASCALVGKAGICSAVSGAPLATHGTCPGATGGECGPRCDGVSTTACSLPTATTSCGAASCADGVATAVGACNGAGACTSATSSCAAYACSPDKKSCLTTCTKTSDCKTGFACDAGACVAPADLGKACTSGATCSTGFCADGVCCATAGCGPDGSCALGATPGTCVKKQGIACMDGSQCAKGSDGVGHCVDGVCCDTGCDGQCQACDVEGYVGACTGVVGDPHGAREKCGGADCAAMACRGADDPTKCTAFANGPTKSCEPAHCDAGKEVAESFCDGAGSCVSPTPSSCGAYKCDDASGKCSNTCKSGSDCAPGFSCRAGRCESGGAECSPDGLKSVGADGTTKDCTPYRCGADGSCATTCDSTDQCVAGTACNTDTHQCATLEATSDDGGGCAIDSPPRKRGATFAIALFLTACAMIRRRRAA